MYAISRQNINTWTRFFLKKCNFQPCSSQIMDFLIVSKSIPRRKGYNNNEVRLLDVLTVRRNNTNVNA
jgi:hypothetical protein